MDTCGCGGGRWRSLDATRERAAAAGRIERNTFY
jgi:hypothetical protein